MSDYADNRSDRRRKLADVALRRNERTLADNATILGESVPGCGSKRRVAAATEAPETESWDNVPKQATHFVHPLPAGGGSDEASGNALPFYACCRQVAAPRLGAITVGST